jgi:GT2 family glycosyltransferase
VSSTGGTPEIAVVVPSHERTLRLRWLLNALEEQTLDRDRFEVVVAHDTAEPGTAELLRTHPLAREGLLRGLAFPPGSGSPAGRRNAGWRSTRAPVVAFTDDDCRPPADWLQRALDAAARHPGAVIQGRTTPDPDEHELLKAPYARTQAIEPPTPHAQTCNILYPREVLEALAGFVEDPELIGEDTELAARARGAGVPYVGAPELLTHHAVDTPSLAASVRGAARWRGLPRLLKLHPAVRAEAFPLRVFWKRTHLCAAAGLAGCALALALWNALPLVLLLPWAWETSLRWARGPGGLLLALVHLPGRAAVDLAEMMALAAGSIRNRTLFL